jgi:DNA-binding MarR family transcriptional regulator
VPKPARPSAAPAPPRFVDGYLAALLAQASHLISSEFHVEVRRAGLTVSAWRVLATLADGREITVGQLAAITVTKQPTLTRLLDRMVARGQVERVAHATDRRYTPIRITAAGTRLVARLIEQARAHEQRVLEPFGLQQAEALKQTLRRMIDQHRTGG